MLARFHMWYGRPAADLRAWPRQILRHQLAVLQRRTPRPQMHWTDRALVFRSSG